MSSREQLEELYGDALDTHFGELAWHWSEATSAIDVAKPVDYACRAGERALAQLAPDEAQRWFTHALELLAGDRAVPDDELRCRLLVGLGEAERQTGKPTYRQTLLDAAELARRRGLTDLLVRSALANNRGIFSGAGEVDQPRLEVLRAALDATANDQYATRAKLLALLAVESIFDKELSERQALVRDAVEAARATNDPRTLAEVLGRTFLAVRVPETLADRVHSTAEACALARGVEDPFLQWLTQQVRASAATDAGDLETRQRCLEMAAAAAQRLGQPHPLWEVRWCAGVTAMLRGDTIDAERCANDALRIALDAGEPDAITIYGVQLQTIRWQQGRLVELVPPLRQAVAEHPRLAVHAMLAWALVNSDQLDEAREQVDNARSDDFALPYDLAWLFASCAWAEAVARVHDTEGARILYDRLAPWAGQIVNPDVAVLGGTAHYLGLLAACLEDYEEAARFFTQAIDMHTAMRAPFFLANTQVEFARALVQRSHPGDREGARVLLHAASEVARGRYAGLERAIGDIENVC